MLTHIDLINLRYYVKSLASKNYKLILSFIFSLTSPLSTIYDTNDNNITFSMFVRQKALFMTFKLSVCVRVK